MKHVVYILLVFYAVSSEEKLKHGSPIKEKHYQEGEHNTDFDHQAILGDEELADEFDHLSPEESKERLGALVDKMDSNKDGTVDASELRAWILNSFHNLNRNEAREAMGNDDLDGNEKLSWSEYVYSHFGMTEQEIENYKNEDLDEQKAKEDLDFSMKYSKEKFQAADENGDGDLDVDEYTAFLYPYEYPRMTDVEVSRVLNEYDKNKDGFIDSTEYLPTGEDGDEESRIAEQENFAFNDMNKDGKLDKEEVKKWVSPNEEEMASEESQHLMEATDTNKDALLTREEILEQYDLWVGSEATDYGNLLVKDEL